MKKTLFIAGMGLGLSPKAKAGPAIHKPKTGKKPGSIFLIAQ